MATKKSDEMNNVAEETKAQDEERVWVMIPYIEGQDPEVTVIINGHITQIKKGRQVQVTRQVASVLENSNQQMMVAYENQQRLKNQRTDL